MIDELELQLLNDFQRDFPLVPKPFARIARNLAIDESLVLSTLSRLKDNGSVSRVGAVFRPNRIGASTLAALAAPPDRLEQIAERVSARSEVNHNYQREHRYNLWFVVTAMNDATVRRVVDEIEQETASEVLYLPMVEEYYIDLGFDLRGRHGVHRDRVTPKTKSFTPNSEDRRLIAAIQDGLPLATRPFAQIGQCARMSEAQVIARLRAMIDGDAIKRFGVIVRHHELGFHANAMAVWDVPEELVVELGGCLSRYPFVTLCYRRKRRRPSWPYNLYCMIHGVDRESVRANLRQLREECGVDAYAHELLFSVRRFKQRGARYSSPLPRSAERTE